MWLWLGVLLVYPGLSGWSGQAAHALSKGVRLNLGRQHFERFPWSEALYNVNKKPYIYLLPSCLPTYIVIMGASQSMVFSI